MIVGLALATTDRLLLLVPMTVVVITRCKVACMQECLWLISLRSILLGQQHLLSRRCRHFMIESRILDALRRDLVVLEGVAAGEIRTFLIYDLVMIREDQLLVTCLILIIKVDVFVGLKQRRSHRISRKLYLLAAIDPHILIERVI